MVLFRCTRKGALPKGAAEGKGGYNNAVCTDQSESWPKVMNRGASREQEIKQEPY